MSSGSSHGINDAASSRFINGQPPEYLVADPSLQGPDRLRLGVAGHDPLGHVVASRPGQSKLGHCDPMEGQVELAVAAPVQAMADVVAGPNWHRRRAVVGSERGSRPEAIDAAGLADELRGCQMTAAWKGHEGRGKRPDQALDLAAEDADRRGQVADPADEVAADPRTGLGAVGKGAVEPGEDGRLGERASVVAARRSRARRGTSAGVTGGGSDRR